MRDPRISHSVYLAWFTFCDPSEVTVLVMPYEYRIHWSLAIVEIDKQIVWLLNSIEGSHPEIKAGIKRMLMALSTYFNNEVLYQVQFRDVKLPQQRDNFSCGWRTLIHAKYILQGLFVDNPPITKATIETYDENFVKRYRASMIKTMLVVSKEKTEKLSEDFVDEIATEITMAMVGAQERTNKYAASEKGEEEGQKEGQKEMCKDDESKPVEEEEQRQKGEEGGIDFAKMDETYKAMGEEKDEEAREGELVLSEDKSTYHSSLGKPLSPPNVSI